MAVYEKSFWNAYEKNLTTQIDGEETVYVKDKTTFHYEKGLTIDAEGQTFYRKAADVKIDAPKHTLTYQKQETYANAQIGYASFYSQANTVNNAGAYAIKTETSTSYNLHGGLFLNPSPIKIKRKVKQADKVTGVLFPANGAEIVRTHKRTLEMHLFTIKKNRIEKLSTKVGRAIYYLQMWGI